MAISIEARAELITLVVGMFGAAPGASVLSDLVAASESGASLKQIAANVANTAEFTSIYPTFLTNEEFATQLVENLVGSTVTATDKANAATEVAAMLNGGASRSSVIVDVIATLNAVPEDNALFGAASTQLHNQVEVATYYTIDKQLSGSSLADLQSVIADVDNTEASVTAAKDKADGTVGPDSTYSLTTSQDSLTGNAGNEIFKALATQDGNGDLIDTLQNVDSIDGGAGNDQLIVTLSEAATVSSTIKNIESIEARFAAAATLDLGNATGVTSVTVADSTVAGIVSNVGSIASLAVKDQTQNVTFTGNTATTLGLTLDGVGATGANKTVTLADVATTLNVTANNAYVDTSAVTKLKTLSVDATGKNNLLLTTPTALTTVNVSGTGTLTLATASTTVTKLDASANSGGVTATVDGKAVTLNGGSGADKITYTAAIGATAKVDLGAGADSLTIAAASTKGAVVNGGDGSDTLSVTGAFLNADSKATYTGFEVLEVSNNTKAAIQFDPTLLTGITSYNVKASADQVEFINLGAAPTVNVVDGTVADLALTLKDATGTTDEVTVVLNNGSTTGANGVVVTSLTATGVETVNLNSAGKVGATNTANDVTLTTLTTSKVVITGSQAIDFTTGAHTATLTVDATAATGKVNVDGALAVGTFNVNAGSGSDTIAAGTTGGFITGNAGADAITAGAGVDTLVYKAAADSVIAQKVDGTLDAAKLDSITTFTSATDKIDLTSLGFTANTQKVVLAKSAVDDAAMFTLADTATFYQDGANITRGVVAVENAGDTYLFVDANKDGAFDASTDLVIKFVGITAIVQADVIFG